MIHELYPRGFRGLRLSGFRASGFGDLQIYPRGSRGFRVSRIRVPGFGDLGSIGFRFLGLGLRVQGLGFRSYSWG